MIFKEMTPEEGGPVNPGSCFVFILGKVKPLPKAPPEHIKKELWSTSWILPEPRVPLLTYLVHQRSKKDGD